MSAAIWSKMQREVISRPTSSSAEGSLPRRWLIILSDWQIDVSGETRLAVADLN